MALDMDAERRLRGSIHRWRDELINLTRANRLLYFKHTRSASLEIVSPGSDRIVEQLGSGKHWDFYQPVPAVGDDELFTEPRPRTNEVVTDKQTPSDLQSSLRALERRALDTFNERGLWTLYLGLGCLRWTDPADGKSAETPLLLYPVRFNRTSLADRFRLWASTEDVVINPALAVKLANDLDIGLPNLDDLDDASPSAVQAAIARALGRQSDWSVIDRCVLHPFAFAKEAMYRDLLDNEDVIAAHPLVRAVALAGASGLADQLGFEPPDLDTLDDVSPPEDLVNVLDADASQRRCVLAAKQGHSFVMDGPPGTGKSQTITNIIAELLHDGKRVLFVSEKAAALDVVEARLTERGLAPFLLELHSNKASRREVAKTLGQSLTRRPRAAERPVDLARLRQARTKLSTYALAVTERHADLGRSVAEVAARLVELGGLPQAPLPDRGHRMWDATFLAEVIDHAASLSRAWGPVEQGDDFVWRDLAEPEAAAGRVAELARLALDVEQASLELSEHQQAVLDELGLRSWTRPDESYRIVQLLELLDHRPACPAHWLSMPTLEDVRGRCEHFRSQAAELAGLVRDLHGEGGPAWRELRPGDGEVLQRGIDAVEANPLRLKFDPTHDLARTSALMDTVEATSRHASTVAAEAATLADAFGAPAPATLQRCRELAELGRLIAAPHRPEPSWLDPAVATLLEPAQAALSAAAADARARAEALREVFRPDVVDLDLRGLRARFTEVHKGVHKLGKAYRSDKRALASATLTGKITPAVVARLDDAIAYQDALQELRKREALHASVLGERYYHGVETDFGEVEAAIAVATEAMKLARGEAAPERLRERLTRGSFDDAQLTDTSARLLVSVDGWLSEAAGQLTTDVTGVCALPVTTVVKACEGAVADLTTIEGVLGRVGATIGHPTSVDESRQLLRRRTAVDRIERSFGDSAVELRESFGDLGAGAASDWSSIASAVGWADAARATLGGPVDEASARAMLATPLRRDAFEPPLVAWREATERLLRAFHAERAASYRAELHASWDDGIRLLSELAGRAGDVTEWAIFHAEREWLRERGFGGALGACIAGRTAAAIVPDVLEHALLRAWLAETISSDVRLRPSRSKDREALVQEFRTLDAEAVDAAAARVINVAAARRPTSRVGEVAVIEREAQKLRRHMPIRELLRAAGRSAQRIKPVFMMSPLAVSTYLPPNLTFDVVIFDEASQVRPSDAINCIYRADQLIVAGDQRQLPPTTFFDQAFDDGTDTWEEDEPESFESVLDLCKASSVIGSLPLTWHYRSRHEALIAFSNREFYDDLLATFPAARHTGDDVGIEVFKVDGVYERGARRVNAVEASKVVERVLLHRRNHPDLSLGVVAFSASQQAEIVAQVEAAALTHPELNDLVAEDRLNGFFVKNLENVQGDERDVIIFSIGYGPDANGHFTMNLGPVSSKTGGWRRLNVAITRARRRVELVTSILPSDLDRGAENPSLVHLKNYLRYALHGHVTAPVADSDSGGGLGVQIAHLLRGWGYEVDESVGLGDHRVDVAVHHPGRAGEYVLGIEADEPDYARGGVARDRDRLRPSLLIGLGWHLHHAWSTAWYVDRDREEQHLRDAINAAISSGPASDRIGSRPPVEMVEELVPEQARPSWVVDYRPVRVQTSGHFPIDDPRSRPALLDAVLEVAAGEGLVHEDLVQERVKAAWHVSRTTAAVRSAIESAIRTLADRGQLEYRRPFLAMPGGRTERVRGGSERVDGSVRRVAHIPPDELELAIVLSLRDARTVDSDELKVFVARAFGWKRVGADISSALDEALTNLVKVGVVERVWPDGVRLATDVTNS